LVRTTDNEQASQDRIQTRLQMLRSELEKGQAELQRIESQRTYLHETILRISGAVQVLEELLTEHPDRQNKAAPSEKQHATAQVSEADI